MMFPTIPQDCRDVCAFFSFYAQLGTSTLNVTGMKQGQTKLIYILNRVTFGSVYCEYNDLIIPLCLNVVVKLVASDRVYCIFFYSILNQYSTVIVSCGEK